MYIYTHTYIYIYCILIYLLHTPICINHKKINICMYIYIYTYIYVYIYNIYTYTIHVIFLYMYTYVCVCDFVCVRVIVCRARVCACACVYHRASLGTLSLSTPEHLLLFTHEPPCIVSSSSLPILTRSSRVHRSSYSHPILSCSWIFLPRCLWTSRSSDSQLRISCSQPYSHPILSCSRTVAALPSIVVKCGGGGGGSSCGRLWCCSGRVMCCVVLFLLCVFVCNLFLFLQGFSATLPNNLDLALFRFTTLSISCSVWLFVCGVVLVVLLCV